MAAENLKSIPVTALDTVPIIYPNAGAGAPGYLRGQNAFLTPTSGATAGSTYKFVRLSTAVCVKHVLIEGAAETAGAYNVGLYYSDGPTVGVYDGTPPSLAGTALAATLFASAYSLASATAEPADITNQAGNYPASARNQPLWQAAGLAADPGGFFDLTLVSTTAPTTGALIGVEVEYAF
ncbi:MAG: hypothetical protein P4N59_11535 [Negativicutes bacterium]|nr:hypothetical protein [Negativicutes bacterium]